ncbi:MAG: OmpH family outer membrane protein [Fimbriimonas sp.]
MKDTRFLQLGWVIAAAFIAVTVAGGFQATAIKIGVVDISKVVETSEFGKVNQDSFTKMRMAREGLLEFIDANRVLTNEQAQQMRDLWLKANPTKEESAKLDLLKADVIAAAKKSTELATKPNMTPEERTLVEEYARRSQTMNDVAQRWFREFTSEMQTWADKQKLDSIDRARAAIQEVAKAEGYTVVLEVGIAPYGANDLTAAALAKMNEKK